MPATTRTFSRARPLSWPAPSWMTTSSTTAPYFQGADLLITADCVPVAYAGYHEDFLKGKAVVMACPKLDDNQLYHRPLLPGRRPADHRRLRTGGLCRLPRGLSQGQGRCHGLPQAG